MPNILITGASGSVGSHLLDRLNLRPYAKVYCLTRGEARALAGRSRGANIVPLRGDLLDLDRLTPGLDDLDTVVHLAAVTGKAPPEDYFRVNVEGTRALVEFCRKTGVKRFLSVSSIAVRFPDKTRYYYAQSKEQSEEIVRSSGLRYAILRPTIILGPVSSTWEGISKLAQLPVIPIFGDGKTPIQPIWVDDLVDFIGSVLEKDLFNGEAFDVGGPEIISMEEFLKKIHILRNAAARTVHLPLALLIPLLSALEELFYSLLPLAVGQLSSFRCDGTTAPNRLYEERRAQLKPINEVLALLDSPDAFQNACLRQECHAFSRYLTGAKPDAYVVRKYNDAHHKVADFSPASRFDRFLVRFAVTRKIFTKLADCYARLFASESALRKKLILLTAILESAAPFDRPFALQDAKSIFAVVPRCALRGFSFLLGLLAAAIVLGPVRLFLGPSRESPREAH